MMHHGQTLAPPPVQSLAVQKTCLTRPEAAKRLGWKLSEVHRMVRLGGLLTVWVRGRQLIPVSELAYWRCA